MKSAHLMSPEEASEKKFPAGDGCGCVKSHLVTEENSAI